MEKLIELLNEVAADLHTAGDNLKSNGDYYHRRADEVNQKILELEGKVVYEP